MFLRVLAIILPLFCITCWYTVPLTPKDEEHFNKLVQESLELRTKHALEEKPAHQFREHVQKDIWTQDETRHFLIQSQQSDLTIYQNREKTEAVERLQMIHGKIDDDLTLSADLGIYTFPSHQFIAEKNCLLSQNQNTIHGSRIHLDLIKEMVSLENPQGHLTAGSIHFEAKRLVWDKKQEKLYLYEDVKIEQEDQFTILANDGVLELDALTPIRMTLQNNVRLIASKIQDKESFAVGDSLSYNTSDETFLFEAKKRVLFWQEGFTLSAPKIMIHKDQTVQGIGDIHFSFDMEEQNYFDNLFKQYLE